MANDCEAGKGVVAVTSCLVGITAHIAVVVQLCGAPAAGEKFVKS